MTKTHPASSLKGLESACTSQLESFAAGVSIHVLSLTLITDDQRCFLSVTLVEFMLLSLVLTTIRPTHCAGCVADALAMVQCLVEVVGVPKDRIQTLLGPKDQHDANAIPSRQNILSTLRSLSTKTDIKRGDPIIFCFAGHGSRYAWSGLDDDNGLNSDKEHDNEHSPARAGFVEALCPIDRDNVPDISDRELNTIFSQIYRTGGHPITVILDCCHGGGRHSKS